MLMTSNMRYMSFTVVNQSEARVVGQAWDDKIYSTYFSSDINIYNYADDNRISFAGNSIDVIENTLNKEVIS